MADISRRPTDTPTPWVAPIGAHDPGPLGWVVDGLRHAFDEVGHTVHAFVADNLQAQATDLSEVDSSAMRLARQQLHQAAGALEMVDLQAPARVVRALDAAVLRLIERPAKATQASQQVLDHAIRALEEFLDRLMRGRAVPDLALFPAYAAVQALAGADRVHPAEFWPDQVLVDVPLPAGSVYQPGPPVRAHLDRLILPVVKGLHAQAAAKLAQLTGGLSRGSQGLR